MLTVPLRPNARYHKTHLLAHLLSTINATIVCVKSKSYATFQRPLSMTPPFFISRSFYNMVCGALARISQIYITDPLLVNLTNLTFLHSLLLINCWTLSKLIWATKKSAPIKWERTAWYSFVVFSFELTSSFRVNLCCCNHSVICRYSSM